MIVGARWTCLCLAGVLIVGTWLCGATAEAAGQRRDGKTARPAEERRLSDSTFRTGLKKRGLTEFLDLHLRDFPPAGAMATLLMRRELHLAEYADAYRPLQARREALAKANRLLETVIRDNPADRRRFDWLFSLGHSLIYDEGEPYFSSILYRGGSRDDHRRLLALTTRAVEVLVTLRAGVSAEYARLDELPVREFDRLERTGYVDALDRLAPRADYLMLWALLYDSLAREDADPTRAKNLNRIPELMAEGADLLETPHEESHVQVQALLLAGMTARLLHDHAGARDQLDRAVNVARRIDDPEESRRVEWAVTLARIERIRNDRDDARFDAAIEGTVRLRRIVLGQRAEPFGLTLVAALLERSVFQAQADKAARRRDGGSALRYRDKAWEALQRLVERHPDRRDEVYATIYDVLDPKADPDDLDPFEQCALVAGLLMDADESAKEGDALLARAIDVGERFVARPPRGATALVPVVLYNVAVANYRRGGLVDAARRFLEVARRFPGFGDAGAAAEFAVRLASSFYEDEKLRGRQDVVQLYRDALSTLVEGYPDTDAARYWRFYYAQLLDEQGAFDEAAGQYAQVDRTHENYVESVLFRLRCLARLLETSQSADSGEPGTARGRLDEFVTIQREFLSHLGEEIAGVADARRAARLRRLAARAKLLLAEVRILPAVAQPAAALDTLVDFETQHPDTSTLAGRVWRVRLIAYERLGRLEEAARAIPAYIAADPEKVGPALESLYLDLVEEVRTLRQAGRRRQADRKAELALLLAQQVYDWLDAQGGATLPAGGRATPAMLKQLAEVHLLAGKFKQARDLFEQCGALDDPNSDRPPDVAVQYGYAEALYQLGALSEALPRFNDLAVRLPAEDRLRWEALLRDLQCRTGLDHSPDGIIQVIEQQRYMHPDLGGPQLASQFEKLLRENRRRADGG